MNSRPPIRFLILPLLVGLLFCAARARGSETEPGPEAASAQYVGKPAPAVLIRLAAAEWQLSREPAAREVQRWAERGGSLEMGEARALLRDSRGAGALPWVRLRGRFEDTGRLDRDAVGIVESKRDDTRWTAELWLEWDLAEAAAGSARFKAVKEVRDQLEVRQAIIHHATLAYHDRQRLLLEEALDELSTPGDVSGLARRMVRQVRIRELDATLDALTNGRWARELARLDRTPPGPTLRDPADEPEMPGEPSRDPQRPGRPSAAPAVAGG